MENVFSISVCVAVVQLIVSQRIETVFGVTYGKTWSCSHGYVFSLVVYEELLFEAVRESHL